MQRLGDLLRKWRIHEERGIRDVAEEIGISAATLSRVENGEMMDGLTLKRILCWLLEHKS